MRVVSFPLSVETDFMNIVCVQPLSQFVAYHRTDVSMCHGDHAHAVVYPCCRVEAEGVSLLHLCGEQQAFAVIVFCGRRDGYSLACSVNE